MWGTWQEFFLSAHGLRIHSLPEDLPLLRRGRPGIFFAGCWSNAVETGKMR